MCTCTCKRGLWKCGATQAIVSPPVPLADFELCRAAVRPANVSGIDGWNVTIKVGDRCTTVFRPRPFLPYPAVCIRAAARQPPDTLNPPLLARSSSTLAHNLYYGRGAHIINLIKRSALKIVLLVRQLLTAVTFLSLSLSSTSFSLPGMRPFSLSFLPLLSSPPPYPLSYQFLYHLFSLLLFVLFSRFALVILTLPIVTLRHVTWKFFNTISVNRTLRFRLFVPPC